MTTKTLDQHIETRPDIARGKPRIAGHRITVRDIVIWHERLGKGVDEIASDYGLTLADVHAALAYYFDHRADIDRGMADGLRQSSPPHRRLTVPHHTELAKGTLRSIIRQAGLTVEEFSALL